MTDTQAGTVAAAPDTFDQPPPDEPHRRSLLTFPVVGLGASAGGLHALQRFFEQMPAGCGMAFVVVVHLSPRHESNVAAILQRTTRMPVRQVTETTPVLADHVYVIPPNKHLSMDDGHLEVADAERVVGRHVAIDLFFRTLAQVHRERAIAVVLSGTGADGAVGLMRVKEYGGLTFAQSPGDAEYDGMPNAAIATRNVDFVLPVVDMPQRLLELVTSARMIRLPPPPIGADGVPLLDASESAEVALKEIKALLRKRTGHDFTHYKRATVLRRIERRLQVNALQSLPAYRDYVAQHADEVGALLQDLLISVTNFFRDRESFETLEREVLPILLERAQADIPLRLWVAGCATGEEAYSIAMQLNDMAAAHEVSPNFQIFATDIDERALAVGRAGLYPLSIVADLPAARLRKYFTREGAQYRIGKPLRERVLFARHNVLRDPPFSRIDLVSCRNLLIYLDRAAQKQVLDTFRLAVGPEGFLFLGTSESPDVTSTAFQVLDKMHRIYRADASSTPARPMLHPIESVPVHLDALRQVPPTERHETRFETLHQQAMEQFAPPSVLIDAAHQILHLSPGVGRFLEHAGGVPSHNLVTIVHPELRLELRTALFKAMQSGKSVEAHTVQMQREGRDVFVNITVRPFQGRGYDGALAIVAFVEVDDSMRRADSQPDAKDRDIVEQLEAELKREKESLQESLEYSETSTEELKASNEELQAINEELRAASEELETGKEELQAVNEELITVNFELKVKIEETGKVNDDLQNLITSTDIATVFVDNALRIKRFTPRALDLFHLIPSDVGRSLLDIRHRLRYDRLADDAAEAFRSLRLIEREVGSDGADETAGRYLVRVLPYRTTNDVIDGATISFIDVTTLRRAEARLREGEAHLRLAAATTKDFAILTMDDAGLITTWNKGAERMYGYAPAEIIGQSSSRLFTPEDRAAGVPERELSTARTEGRAEDERWHLRKDNTRFFCSGVVTPFESGDLKGLAKIGRDITGIRREQTTRDAMLVEERAARTQYEAAARLKDEFLAVMSHELKHPLNLIHVNAELLSRMPRLRDVPAAVRAAQIIRKTVVGQGKIIDDLLDLSRVRTGKLTLQVVPVDLGMTIDAIVTAMQADAQAKSITLEYEPDALLGLVACDPVRVEQIFWNLLSNALKFTPENGRVEVHTEIDGPFARLSISDTGKGIAAAFLPHVFDMFGQDQSATKRQDGGMGIGLALVRELALAQGGRVEARSDGVGRGARFDVWLPLYDSRRRGLREADAAPGRSLAGLHILVVEDAREALEPFIELLRLEGALPTAAVDGRDALALLDQQNFDLVISDIAMPEVGGYEFISEVRRHPRAASLPAIALTGYGRDKDRQHSLEAGFDAHLTKPASIRDLRQALDHLDVAASGTPPAGEPTA